MQINFLSLPISFGDYPENTRGVLKTEYLLVIEYSKGNLFTNNLHYWLGERHEDVDESVSDQWQVEEEIHGETFEAPATDDMLRQFENEIPEAYETPDSVQKGIWITKYI